MNNIECTYCQDKDPTCSWDKWWENFQEYAKTEFFGYKFEAHYPYYNEIHAIRFDTKKLLDN